MKTQNLIITAFVAASILAACKKSDTVENLQKIEDVAGQVSGTWAKGTTYKVTDDIIISEGKSLTIEAGAVILFSDTIEKPEVIIQGNLYILGTSSEPVKFTVDEALKTQKPWGQLWGGFIASGTTGEIVITNAIIEYGGATTTDASSSVKLGLYKGESGENVPALYANNVNGKIVFTNNIVRNFAEDGLYIEGGNAIISNNTIYTTGISGGDAINLKSGVLADVAFNTIYSPNTNALKLSNTGGRNPQAYIKAYNNTIINAGWRRPTVKGGSIWLESNVRAEICNNLLVNNRFGIKHDKKDQEDDRSIISYNLYYGNDQTTVDQFQVSTVDGIIGGMNEIKGTTAGQNDPKFVNFPLSNDINNSTFNIGWNFKLKAGSPALNSGSTSAFIPHFSSEGMVVNGVTYKSPALGANIGASVAE